MPGMATTQARHGQSRATQGAMLFQRLHRILGTRRIKPAIAPEPRTEQVPVHAYQGDEEFCHREIRDHIAARSPNRSLFILFATPGLANTTTSTAASWAWCCRKLSRTTRLTRFRSTARAAALRETTVPKRAWSRPFARARTVNAPRLNRRDPSKTALNWTDSHKRWRRASANDTAETSPKRLNARGPWHDDASVFDGLLLLPYEHGNRGYAYASERSVDKYASYIYTAC